MLATVGPRRFLRTRDGGGSYISSNDSRLHFGLGDAKQIDRLEVRWPSGQTTTRTDVLMDSVIDVHEEPPPTRP